MADGSLPSGWAFHRLSTTHNNNDSDQLAGLKQFFDEDGFICLSSVLDSDKVERLHDAASANFDGCFQRLYDRGHIAFPHYRRRYCDTQQQQAAGDEYEYALEPGVKGGFREVVMRSPGRFEMPYGCDEPPFSDDYIRRNGIILGVVRALLADADDNNADEQQPDDTAPDDDNFYLCNASVVTATPGSTLQGWHADGGHMNLQAHDPCHCLNVFIPLVDVTMLLGPTELRPGSHYLTRNLAPMMLAAKARGRLQKPVTPLLRAGDALVFDYRTLHRGLANVGEISRPILVQTYCKKWFRDMLNFPKRSIEDDAVERSN